MFREILWRMKPEAAANSVSEGANAAAPSAVPAGTPAIDPITLFSVLRHPLRLKLLRIMAGARPLSATEASLILHQKVNIVIQQFQILRQSGLVATAVSSEDARVLLYYIPTKWIAEVNVLKLDFCVINFAAIPDYALRKRRS
jgi:predicted transcriptional regulator